MKKAQNALEIVLIFGLVVIVSIAGFTMFGKLGDSLKDNSSIELRNTTATTGTGQTTTASVSAQTTATTTTTQTATATTATTTGQTQAATTTVAQAPVQPTPTAPTTPTVNSTPLASIKIETAGISGSKFAKRF